VRKSAGEMTEANFPWPGRFRTPTASFRVSRHTGYRPTMPSFGLGCYRRALGSHYRTVYWQGCSVGWRSMATVVNGHPPHPGPTADLDSHLLAALHWSAQNGATLGDLSHEFNTNSGRILDMSLPYESTPPLSRRLTFDRAGSGKTDRGIVMVAHCMSSKDDFDPQKSKVKLSSGFVIGNGLIVTCAHTFEEVSSSVIRSDKPVRTRTTRPGPEIPIVRTCRQSALWVFRRFRQRGLTARVRYLPHQEHPVVRTPFRCATTRSSPARHQAGTPQVEFSANFTISSAQGHEGSSPLRGGQQRASPLLGAPQLGTVDGKRRSLSSLGGMYGARLSRFRRERKPCGSSLFHSVNLTHADHTAWDL